MLEQLEKNENVKSAMANHTGTLVRVVLVDAADVTSVASELESILVKQNRKPRQLFGDDVAAAISDETWRTAETIGELSEIEFRTVFAKRVKKFSESADLSEENMANLVSLSKKVLAETEPSNRDTDFRAFCGGMAERMIEGAKAFLTDEQAAELAKMLKGRVLG